MKKLLLLISSLIITAITACSEEPSHPREGGLAPDFALTSLSGETVRLHDLRGKVVLLNFWATWCPPCREEIPSLVSLNASMRGKSFQMLTVTNEGRETVLEFYRKRAVNLPTLLDSGSVTRRYGIKGFPETLIIGKDGVIRKKVIGPLDWSDGSVFNYLENLVKE